MEDKLQQLGFTRIEAAVYLNLVKTGSRNGSQIAKDLGLPRTSVYAALAVLYERGEVLQRPGDVTSYLAVAPTDLLARRRESFEKAATELEESFKKMEGPAEDEAVWNLTGWPSVLEKARALIREAERELYINTGLDLELLREDLSQARERGVRVLVYSFSPVALAGVDLEIYYNPRWQLSADSPYVRLMLCSERGRSLLAGGLKGGACSGVTSCNPLLAAVMAEHIHSDLYLFKLEKKMGMNLFTPDLLMGSLHEAGFKAKSQSWKRV